MSNKNQHFVSQTYLRRFGIPADCGQPRAINLLAINAGKVVAGASIKNQCSKNFFYGRDKKIDEALQFFERRYGSAMAAVEKGDVSRDNLDALVQFMFLQFLRTPFWVQQRLRVIEEFSSLEVAGKRVREHVPPPNREHEALHQLYIFAKEASAFADLEPILLQNRTELPFITSDNPSMCMNRLYHQRYGDETAGVIQSGTLACLPITPRLTLLAYDADVYQRIGRGFIFDVRNVQDVNRLNELQVLRATDALFFQDLHHQAYVATLLLKHGHRRRDDWTITWTGIRDAEDEQFERFRRIMPEDKDSLEPRIQSMSPILPAPSTWPSFLKFKMRPKGWSNGSIVGFVREAHTHRANGFQRGTLPDRIPRERAPAYRDEIYQRKTLEDWARKGVDRVSRQKGELL